jgi:hypothetical protein
MVKTVQMPEEFDPLGFYFDLNGNRDLQVASSRSCFCLFLIKNN